MTQKKSITRLQYPRLMTEATLLVSVVTSGNARFRLQASQASGCRLQPEPASQPAAKLLVVAIRHRSNTQRMGGRRREDESIEETREERRG